MAAINAGSILDTLLNPDTPIVDDFVSLLNNGNFDDLELDPLHNEIIHALTLESPAFFARFMMMGPLEAPYFGRVLIGDHHLEWDHILSTEKRACILSARDHGKTFFCSKAYPIFLARKYPRESTYIFSATKPQAVEILDKIKAELEENPKLQYLVPGRKLVWSSTKIVLSNGHTIYARGYGTKVRGAHPKVIIVDDCLNDEDAYSETIRTKNNDYFFNAITNMVIPGGQIVVIGTPFHGRDLYGELKKNPVYFYKEFPAESNPGKPNNIVLWPERYPLAALLEKKIEVGTIRYGRELLVNPISDEMSLFPKKLFEGSPVEQFELKLGLPLEFWRDKGIDIFIGVDFAISATVQADYTVIIVLGVDDFGNRWLIDIYRGKGLEYQKQKSLINKYGRLYDPFMIFLEANQMQSIFGDELIRETDLPIQKYTTGVEKHSLEKGVPELRVLLENGKFRIPRGDKDSVEKTDILIEEMGGMTFLEGKVQSVGEHDDTVMALWIANQAVKTGGFSFSFGESKASPVTSTPEIVVKETKATVKDPKDDLKVKIIGDISKGKGIYWCTDEDYPVVRNLLQDYAEECIENGAQAYTIIALEEVKRLDAKFNFSILGE